MLASFFGGKYPAGEILRDYGVIFPVAFLVSFVAAPVCRKLAWRYGIVDRPNETVKTHAAPTAYLGGVGILAGLLAGLAAGCWLLGSGRIHVAAAKDSRAVFHTAYASWQMLAGIGLGAAIACGVGVLDDLYDLSPGKKFLGQALAAGVLLAAGVMPNMAQVLGHLGVEAPRGVQVLLSVPVVLFFILGATNSLNLLDGLDGLCAGVTAIITTALALLAVGLASWEHSRVGDPMRLVLCLALAGATLGFLPMNRHPARIFMGDAGSILLGFSAGTLMLLFAETIGRWTVAGVIIFGLPILDTAVALVRRFVNKKPLFASDRGHIYDQLMDRGIPLGKTVAICYVLAGLYAAAGLAVAQLRFRYAAASFAAVAAASAWVVWRKGFLQLPDKSGAKR